MPNYTMVADAEAYALTGFSTGLVHRVLTADVAAYTLTGFSTNLNHYVLTADIENYTYQSYSANLVHRVLTATTAAYTETGIDTGLLFGYMMNASLEAPAFTVNASMSPGTLYGGSIEAPGFTFSGWTGGQAEVEAPGVTFVGSVLNDNILRLNKSIGANVTGHIFAGSILSAELEAPGITFAAQTGMQGKIKTPSFSMTASIKDGAVIRATIVAPGIAITGAISQGGTLNAVLEAPAIVSLYGIGRLLAAPQIQLIGSISQTAGTVYIGYATNIKNGAITQYTSYDFDFLFRFDGEQYGVSGGQVYHLEGLDDAGVDIAAYFETPPMDFGTTNLKRMPYMYVGCKSDNHLDVEARADEQVTIARFTKTIGRNRRARVSRGVKGRFWSAKVSNKDGEYFGIDTLELMPMKLRRKV